jgi:type IV pilus assembly protein PilC
MLFKYQAVDQQGNKRDGDIDAISIDVAINSLQRRGLIVAQITPADQARNILEVNVTWFDRVSIKDIVIMSRQMATLFESQVSALRVFRLLAEEAGNKLLQRTLNVVADDIQGGSQISAALAKHPKVFSQFYINMVKAGEEAGKLDETFQFLADYMDRSYEVSSKAKNALIYPAFVIGTFFIVMGLMLTMVIPKISTILKESGQEIPIYTKVVIGMSEFMVNYGIFFIIFVIVGVIMIFRLTRTGEGKLALDQARLVIPYVGDLYRKLYLSRIADNFSTMLTSGIAVVEAVEISSKVVDNKVYENVLLDAAQKIRGGASISDALQPHAEIPGIMIAMIRVGEETGELGNILKTLAKFYQREVTQAVDTLVDLIEPAMIVLLGAGVGFLLAAVMIPIYNISSAF